MKTAFAYINLPPGPRWRRHAASPREASIKRGKIAKGDAEPAQRRSKPRRGVIRKHDPSTRIAQPRNEAGRADRIKQFDRGQIER